MIEKMEIDHEYSVEPFMLSYKPSICYQDINYHNAVALGNIGILYYEQGYFVFNFYNKNQFFGQKLNFLPQKNSIFRAKIRFSREKFNFLHKKSIFLTKI
jgi:hypothetical protein